MRYLLLLAFIGVLFSGNAQSLPPEVITSIQNRINEGKNPGIVIGIVDKEGDHYYSFGLTKENGRPADEHTLYEIGSITKVFTATLLADQIVKGQLKDSDPIRQYLPPTVRIPQFEGQDIQLGHLSDHTSSLPRLPGNFDPADPMNPYADYTIDRMYDFLSGYTLSRPVGSAFEYSNLAVGLLGQILSQTAGMTYEELVQKVITMPLEMNSTAIQLDKKAVKKLAPGHYGAQAVPNWDLGALEGAGAIRSSVHEMLQFIKLNLFPTETILGQAAQLTQVPRHDKRGDGMVGLGWFIDKTKDGEIVYHSGATGGYNAFAGFNKSTQKGVVVLTNSNESIEDLGLHLISPTYPLQSLVPHVTIRLKEIIDTEGTDKLFEKYRDLKMNHAAAYTFSEDGINSLGYYYLNRKQNKEAQELFKLNMEEYPTSSNVYDSYAESLMEANDTARAIQFYQKSLAINPGNLNAIAMLEKMGVIYTQPATEIATDILESYTGTYELAPGFHIVVTREDHHLMAQATSQAAYEIFPKDEFSFYYKVVDAQIVFQKNDKGQVNGLELHQAGRILPGRKIK